MGAWIDSHMNEMFVCRSTHIYNPLTPTDLLSSVQNNGWISLFAQSHIPTVLEGLT